MNDQEQFELLDFSPFFVPLSLFFFLITLKVRFKEASTNSDFR